MKINGIELLHIDYYVYFPLTKGSFVSFIHVRLYAWYELHDLNEHWHETPYHTCTAFVATLSDTNKLKTVWDVHVHDHMQPSDNYYCSIFYGIDIVGIYTA